jgi:protein-L-isoaspartate(D-aspartate) O-methyltransferase
VLAVHDGVVDAADLRDRLLGQGISRRIVDIVVSVPRDRFVPRELRVRAWEDHALPIGHGQTISQPTVVAVMTEAAAVGPGDTVLDVGTGSGYQAAILAATGARVHAIERIPALADAARERLAALGYDVDLHIGDGTRGLPELAPFDAIVVAAATPSIPPALTDQLRLPEATRRGGRLVIPVGEPGGWLGSQELLLIERTTEGLHRRKLLDVVFVPLVADHP